MGTGPWLRTHATQHHKATSMNLRIKLASLAALAVTASAFADIKVNDNLTTSGYVVGSYQYNDTNASTSSDKFDLDAAKILFSYNLKPVTGVVSFYHAPGAPENIALLDAYATYDVGSGFTVTGGKFLSYLGYEAFDIPNMTQISYANGSLGVIPGYHDGVKLDYSDATQAFGLAILDSVYSGANYLKGDGELKHNAGFEGYYSYKGIKDLTLWSGFAYETKSGPVSATHSILDLDFWASYQLNKETVLAAEYAHKDGGTYDKGYNWLALVGYTFTDKVSGIARISGESVDTAGSIWVPGKGETKGTYKTVVNNTKYTKYTLCPTYTLTANLSIRAEYSYIDYTHSSLKANFLGLQGIFKF